MTKLKVGAVLGALTLVFAALILPEASARPLDAHTEMVEHLKRACDATCDETCLVSSEHKVTSGGTNATKGYGLHGCLSISSGCGYHNCNQTSVDPEVDLFRMVADASIEELTDVVGESNRVYVAEREVLQIIADCGKVLAQVPLSRLDARALSLD